MSPWVLSLVKNNSSLLLKVLHIFSSNTSDKTFDVGSSNCSCHCSHSLSKNNFLEQIECHHKCHSTYDLDDCIESFGGGKSSKNVHSNLLNDFLLTPRIFLNEYRVLGKFEINTSLDVSLSTILNKTLKKTDKSFNKK